MQIEGLHQQRTHDCDGRGDVQSYFRAQVSTPEQERTIEPSPIFTSRVLPSGKSNMTTIRSVGIHSKAGQLILHRHTEAHKHSYSTVIAMQHNDVAAPKRMQHTGPSVVVQQEAHNNNEVFRGGRSIIFVVP